MNNFTKNDLKIILVEPKDPINIGSVARVMDNFGFTNLAVVTKEEINFAQAKRSACWADKLMDNAEVFEDLYDAVKDCSKVVGFSTKSGKGFPPVFDLHEATAALFTNNNVQNIALVFGPEDTGLTKQHLSYVTDIVRIPTHEKNPSMNLSHAVAVTLFHLCNVRGETEGIFSQSDTPELATFSELKNLEKLIFRMCESTGFFNENTPGNLPEMVANIFRRAGVSKRELSILEGIFGKAIK